MPQNLPSGLFALSDHINLYAVLGVNTVDVGAPQLGMHSIRETTGWKDPLLLYQALLQVFESEKL